MSVVVTTLQSERQELSSSHRRLDVVVAEARRLIDVYHSDDTSKMTGDLQLITAHWQQLVDRYASSSLLLWPVRLFVHSG